MANSFLQNLRAARNTNARIKNEGEIGHWPERRDMVMDNRREAELNRKERAAHEEHAKMAQKWVDEQVKETAPLRDAISQATNGRVTVDNSIYDKTQLKRILGSVVAMQEYAGGALPSGYAVIADSTKAPNFNDNSLGETSFSVTRYNEALPDLKIRFPQDNYGSKNSPYRVYLRDANETNLNDWVYLMAAVDDWLVDPSKKTDEYSGSVTHTHELAHTAQGNALQKTKNPALTLNYNEKMKRQQFRDTHKSLQDMFEVAAKNAGFETVRDAAKSISDYAYDDVNEESGRGGRNESANWSPNYRRLAEVFAEAYTDVLYNKDKASAFSKELVNLYVDYVNDYNRTFDNGIVQDVGILPTKDENFVNNWREMYFGKKK